MNSLEINKILKSDIYAKYIFKGVFPSDRLPKKVKYPSAYVINTDPHTKPGEHWVHVYFANKKFAYYFDSFGLPPKVPNILKFLINNAEASYFNSVTLQHNFSTVCGHYCCVVLGLSARRISFPDIISKLNCRDPLMNDENVISIFTAMFEHQSVCNRNCVRYIQSCCSKVGML